MCIKHIMKKQRASLIHLEVVDFNSKRFYLRLATQYNVMSTCWYPFVIYELNSISSYI
jgi:uncharacterized protein YueI